MSHCEIERKYLIAMPNEALLRSKDGCEIWDIEQTYLTAPKGETRRVRQVTENGETRWYRTFKRRVTDVTAQEDEGQIDRAEYETYLTQRDPARRTIVKRRYRIPFEGQTLEIDVYPFWQDRAVLEIELKSEDEPTRIPPWLTVFREVTEDSRYKNARLALAIPMDEL